MVVEVVHMLGYDIFLNSKQPTTLQATPPSISSNNYRGIGGTGQSEGRRHSTRTADVP
jgi:hypothetical protein